MTVEPRELLMPMTTGCWSLVPNILMSQKIGPKCAIAAMSSSSSNCNPFSVSFCDKNGRGDGLRRQNRLIMDRDRRFAVDGDRSDAVSSQ